jgi:hypothetical protein
MKRRLKIPDEALAFRIWQMANPVNWGVSAVEIAAALGVERGEVERVCRLKRWRNRLAPSEAEALPYDELAA